MFSRFLGVALLLILATQQVFAAPAKGKSGLVIPNAPREMRGVWVATVANIDWPTSPGLSTDEQKAELVGILDRCVELNMNCVVLQVRPMCDALYKSDLEPWSYFLTGKMGQAPEPYYDPLEFACEEAHNRGLEMHCWFNPYRAKVGGYKGNISDNHVGMSRTNLAKSYGKSLWLDPGEKEVQDISHDVIMDVVKRYDIDGVHMDDYFYPYKEKGPDGKILDFPDEPSWQKYVKSGGKLKREDWRRNNVDKFIKRIYYSIKAEKPEVRFGISPFGIWKPGYPAQIKGFSQYDELYADAKLWLEKGWVDYWTPQLYWTIANPDQSYPVLLKWWCEQNRKGRNVWPGLFTGKWPAQEIKHQVQWTRLEPGASGNVHFSMKVFMKKDSEYADALTTAGSVYAKKALVPASPWLDSKAPARPEVAFEAVPAKDADSSATIAVNWKPGRGEKPWLWVVYSRAGEKWSTDIVPAATTTAEFPAEGKAAPDVVAVSGVDRVGNESARAVLTIPETKK